MPKAIVVYVTRSGHSRTLAQEAGKTLSAPVYEIVDLVDRRGLAGMLRSARDSVTRRATPIREPKVSLAGVDTVVLVQPIWALGVCPPLRSWLSSHRKALAGKRIALLASNLGTPGGRVKKLFEGEFGALCAFTVVAEHRNAAARAIALATFAAALA